MTPDSHTNQEIMLDVGDGHTLYVHDWGRKDAKTPIVFLHGGPGGSVEDRHKNLFDPSQQRVIFYDQRGGGQSLPYGSLDHNTTQDLVEDIEKILQHFGIEQCLVTGGSWGSALAFYFATAHPERVAGMVLHGIWTCTKAENDWVDKGGFKTFFPDAWERYENTVPPKFQKDPSAYHFPRVLKGSEQEKKESGHAYQTLEGAALKLDDRQTPQSVEDFDYNGVRIEVHYLSNACFMPEGFIMDNIEKLTMPVRLVQGRYDMLCPPVTAYRLNERLADSQLFLTTAGHTTEHESWSIIRLLLSELSEK